jgi:hypothetical protein
MKRSLNAAPGQVIPIKHICFLILIDQNHEDCSISFGKEWMQYTVDLLNGKGHSEMPLDSLINKKFSDLILASVSQNSLFESSLIDSLSKIYYNKDQMFIKERIKKIQQIFQDEDNAEYLRMLIEKKLE